MVAKLKIVVFKNKAEMEKCFENVEFVNPFNLTEYLIIMNKYYVKDNSPIGFHDRNAQIKKDIQSMLYIDKRVVNLITTECYPSFIDYYITEKVIVSLEDNTFTFKWLKMRYT